MLAVDEGMGRILDALKETGVLENTLVIFTSENGYFYGEHGLTIERRLPYEEAVKTPLLMRYPQLIKPGRKSDGLVVSIDLAPTILEVADVEIPNHIQGTSLTPLLKGQADEVHDSILIEFYSHENPFPWTASLDYRIVRKGKYKYIRWLRFEDQAELYDLETDPYELNNLVNSPNMTSIIQEMKSEMRQLVLKSLGLLD